jgi:hypothetical protein
MHHSPEDFARLSQQHATAANRAASRKAHEMNLELAQHYARIAVLKSMPQRTGEQI